MAQNAIKMDEFTLGKKLQNLQTIKPNTEWVAFNKSEILGKEFDSEQSWSFGESVSTISSIFKTPRLASVYAGLAFVVFGLFGVSLAARNSMPGDPLYAVKQAQENVQMAMIISPEQKTVAQVNQASNRLDELDKISKQTNNETQKIAAINETKKAIAEAAKEITKLSADQQASLIGKLATKIQDVEKTSNAAIMDKDEPSFDSIYKFLAESEIKEFDANIKNLTPKQKDLLQQAKDSFDVSEYGEALDTLYQIQPNADKSERDD
jgi:hypothetical protein